MKSRIDSWQLLQDSMQRNIAVMLLYVLDSNGSSPGRQGFFMVVNAEDQVSGSIGGGIMEHKFVEMAKDWIRNTNRVDVGPLVRKQVHDKSSSKDQSGMICSGEQTVLLYPVQQKDLPAISETIRSLETNRNGELSLSPAGITFSGSTSKTDTLFEFQSAESWRYIEQTGYRKKLIIIGGGHCSYALSRVIYNMDFYISIYEDRRSLITLEKNEFVHEKILVDDYSRLTDLIAGGSDHYIVIMTVGYRTDDLAIRALVGKEFSFLGVLGSKFKTQRLMETYHSEGINPSWLQRIAAPAGLSIHSRTPDEIAISIAAQIIMTANNILSK